MEQTQAISKQWYNNKNNNSYSKQNPSWNSITFENESSSGLVA